MFEKQSKSKPLSKDAMEIIQGISYLQQDNDRLRELLKLYGWHQTACPHYGMSQQDTEADRENFPMECTCGFHHVETKFAALAEQPEGEKG